MAVLAVPADVAAAEPGTKAVVVGWGLGSG